MIMRPGQQLLLPANPLFIWISLLLDMNGLRYTRSLAMRYHPMKMTQSVQKAQSLQTVQSM